MRYSQDLLFSARGTAWKNILNEIYSFLDNNIKLYKWSFFEWLIKR